MSNVELKGIDVSQWQGTIDWKSAAKDIQFAILRAGYGRLSSQKDKQFDANYSGATAAKIPVGAYWYNYAATPDDAKKEAEACLTVIKGKSFDYPIFYDIEESNVLALGKTKVSAIAEAFLSTVKAAGYKVGLYSMASALNASFTATLLSKYDVWVAHVDVDKPAYTKDYAIWQNTWKGKIAGISGDVDCDICYKSYVAAQPKQEAKPKQEGKLKQEEKPKPVAKTDTDYQKAADAVIAGTYGNGAARIQKLTAEGFDASKVQALVDKKLSQKQSTSAPAETLSSVACAVIRGDYGVGAARIQKLTAKGYNATNVQACVNAILSNKPIPVLPLKGKSVDELAQEVIKGLWGNGDGRKRRLAAAGYNAAEVQLRVNYLLSK